MSNVPAANCPTCGAPASAATQTYRTPATMPPPEEAEPVKIDVIDMLRLSLVDAGEVTAAQHQLIADTAAAMERNRIEHKGDLEDLLSTLLEFGVKAATGELKAEDFKAPVELARKLLRSIP